MSEERVWVIGEVAKTAEPPDSRTDPSPAHILATALGPGAKVWDSGEQIGPTDKTVVLVEGLRDGLAGLALFEEALANPSNAIRHALVLAFHDADALREDNRYGYLLKPEGWLDVIAPEEGEAQGAVSDGNGLSEKAEPESYDPRNPALLPLLARIITSRLAGHVDGDEVKWSLLAFDASQHRVAVTASAYRHSHKNLIAAVRIYIGALLAGDVPLESAPHKLEMLCILEEAECKKSGASTSMNRDWKPLLAGIGAAKSLFERALQAKVLDVSFGSVEEEEEWRRRQEGVRRLQDHRTQRSDRLKQVRVRLVDDQFDKLGWQLVLSQFLPKVKCHASVSDFCNLDDDKWAETEVLLLDCDLGKGDPLAGLGALPALRKRSIDLPIVMMTAFDDASLAVDALRAGCNDFFAKALQDRDDRNSLDYYLRLCEILCRLPWEPRLRQAWREFLRTESRLEAFSATLAQAVRHAFLLLFAAADDNLWWPWRLPKSHACEPTHDVEELKRHRLLAEAVGLADAAHTVAFNGNDRLKPQCPISWRKWVLTVDGELRPARQADTGTLNDAVNAANHTASVSAEQAVGVLAVLCKMLGRSSLPAKGVALPHAQDTPWRPRTAAITSQPHGASQDLCDIDLNLEDAVPAQPKHGGHVLFVDDRVDQNGWLDGLKRCLGVKGLFVEGRPTLLPAGKDQPWTDACPPNLALLDLWRNVPDRKSEFIDGGLDDLRRLVDHAPWLPVVIFSKGLDTVPAMRCLRLGAADYVPKSFAVSGIWGNEADAVELFQDAMSAYTALVTKTGRDLWREIGKQRDALDELWQRPLSSVARVRANTGGPTVDLPGLVGRHLDFAFGLYLMGVRREHASTAPSIDHWRTRRLLGSAAGDCYSSVCVSVGRAVELMGWAWACKRHGHHELKCLTDSRFGGIGGRAAHEHITSACSAPGSKAWAARQAAFYGAGPVKPPAAATAARAEAALRNACKAVAYFVGQFPSRVG